MTEGETDSQTRYRRYLEAEREAVGLYAAMADAETDPRRAEVFRELAESEQRHVAYWSGKLGLSPDESASSRVSFRVRVLGWLARILGTRLVLPLVLRIEGDDTVMYAGDPEAAQVMAEGLGHSQVLHDLREGRIPGGHASSTRWDRAVSGGAVRAAVLGVNDGLVSNFGLVWGVAGGTSDTQIVLLAGVAGLLAGAFSMAAGEYVSMRAHRDLSEYRLEIERREIEELPEEEKRELALIYRLKGMTNEEADALAERIMQDPKVALDTMAREELGIDPNQLGSPWGAAVSSFISFTMGAVVPVLPYALGATGSAFFLSGVLSAIALFTVGSALALMSRKWFLRGGLRMLTIGMATALVTFGIGSLIGIGLN